MQIEFRKLKNLIPYPRNAKAHSPYQVDLIAESIRSFGFNIPLVISVNGEIVTGHGRKLAADKLGMEEVPCVVIDTLTPAQIKAFRLADNKVAESNWLEDILADELMQLSSGNYGDQFTGFSKEELEKILNTPILEWDKIADFTTIDTTADTVIQTDEEESEEEEKAEVRDNQKFALAIVLTWSQMQQWKVLKQRYSTTKDTETLLEIIKEIE